VPLATALCKNLPAENAQRQLSRPKPTRVVEPTEEEEGGGGGGGVLLEGGMGSRGMDIICTYVKIKLLENSYARRNDTTN
jgi:hypothetical protein